MLLSYLEEGDMILDKCRWGLYSTHVHYYTTYYLTAYSSNNHKDIALKLNQCRTS